MASELDVVNHLLSLERQASPGPWGSGEGCVNGYIDYQARDDERGGVEPLSDYDGREPVAIGVGAEDRAFIVAMRNECVRLLTNYAAILNACAAAQVDPAREWEACDRNHMADLIYQALIDYRCVFTQIEDDGGAMPLIDLLSPGSSKVSVGKEECSEIAGVVADAILSRLAPAPAPAEGEGRGPATPETVNTLLLLTGLHEVPVRVLETWSQELLERCGDWAVKSHLEASDHDDVVVPPMPDELKRYEPPPGTLKQLFANEEGHPDYEDAAPAESEEVRRGE